MKTFFRSAMMAATLAIGAMGLGAAPAAAATLTTTSATLGASDVGTTFTVDFSCSAPLGCSGGVPQGTLSGWAEFRLTGFDNTTQPGETWWDFEVRIRNTSNALAGGFLTALGFAADPNAILDGVWNANSDGINWNGGAGSIPGFSTTELCLRNGNNCSAANEHDMIPGRQDRMGFSLTTTSGSSLLLSNFVMRFAGNNVTGGSYATAGTIRGGITPVPLPAAGGMLLLGLAGLALVRRGRKAA